MRALTENPAVRLKRAARQALPNGMLRFDTSGRALLVSDAARRGAHAALPLEAETITLDGLLYIDLPEDAYRALLASDFFMPGNLQDGWFAEQTLLSGILRHNPAPEAPDKPLLRAAMIACASGETPVRGFIRALRGAHAAALRCGRARSCRAAATLCAHFLFIEKGVGLPIHPPYDILFFDNSAHGAHSKLSRQNGISSEIHTAVLGER